MRRQSKRGIEWLEFELLSEFPNLSHAVFLRPSQEGKSKAERLQIMQALLGDSSVIKVKQVHGAKVIHIPSSEENLECDGLLTQKPNYLLTIQHADCQAAIFYDPVKKILGNVHAGWRGQVKNIYGEMVRQMKDLGSDPSDILVAISPSLGPCCAEFVHYQDEFPCSFWQFQVPSSSEGSPHFNLWAITQWQLEELGVLPHHIEIAGICTKCHPKDFFSYRRGQRFGPGNLTVAKLVPFSR